MAYSKKQSKLARQSVSIGDSEVTGTLDGTTTTETITLSCVAEKVSFQGSGTLAGNVTFSIDGVNFGNSTAIGAANAIVTFNTHMVKVVKVTRTGGTGKLAILAK